LIFCLFPVLMTIKIGIRTGISFLYNNKQFVLDPIIKRKLFSKWQIFLLSGRRAKQVGQARALFMEIDFRQLAQRREFSLINFWQERQIFGKRMSRNVFQTLRRKEIIV